MSDSAGIGEASERPRHFLWRKPRTRWLLGIPVGGFLLFFVGVAAWAGFNAGLKYSDTLQFCESCHEMRDNIVPGYEEGPHYKNMAGVRAVCADCHVPHAFVPKMQIKIQKAFNEIPKWALGTLDTPEKFRAVQLELAERVWASMKLTDSRECKNCHSLEAMDLSAQDASAAKKHVKERMLARNETCIDCHKSVGHSLPSGYEE